MSRSHSFSVTTVTLGSRLFFILLQINLTVTVILFFTLVKNNMLAIPGLVPETIGLRDTSVPRLALQTYINILSVCTSLYIFPPLFFLVYPLLPTSLFLLHAPRPAVAWYLTLGSTDGESYCGFVSVQGRDYLMRVFKDEDGLHLEVDRDLERLMHSVQASVRQARNRALLLFMPYFDLFSDVF